MTDYFYQIKVRKTEFDKDEFWATPWHWPPVFSGKVTADDRKKARAMIEEEFGKDIPLRSKNEEDPYLLRITEIKERDDRTRKLFEIVQCKDCGDGFRTIDHYNNPFIKYKGNEFCSDECCDQWKLRDRNERMFAENENCDGNRPPVIYQITNNVTQLSYIGQTTQAFTLRWWQHFFHGTDTKFHRAIKESDLTDWKFTIVEVINMKRKPEDMSPTAYINSREQFWITTLDTIKNGYNTATAKSEPDSLPLFESQEAHA